MIRLLFLLFAVFLSTGLLAQESEIEEQEINLKEEVIEDPVFTVCDEMPYLPICAKLNGKERNECVDAEIVKFIVKNTIYPSKDICTSGMVFVQFVVGKSGDVEDVQIVRSVDKLLDKEAIRVVSALPHFIPGKQQGKNVRVLYSVPVRFQLR